MMNVYGPRKRPVLLSARDWVHTEITMGSIRTVIVGIAVGAAIGAGAGIFLSAALSGMAMGGGISLDGYVKTAAFCAGLGAIVGAMVGYVQLRAERRSERDKQP
jgi:hypothetical protein